MEHASPSADRISAALRAVRRIYAENSVDKAVLGLKSLQAVMAELAVDGVPVEDLKPLADLEAVVLAAQAGQAVAAVAPSPAPVPPQMSGYTERQRDRRRKAPPSESLLARCAVMIDLLIKDGQGEEKAAQKVMRYLMLAGIPAPTQGGDSRGWHRLLEFRNTLHKGSGSEEARVEYEVFGKEVDDIPPSQRLEKVLTERLWDRRRQVRREAG